MNLDVFRSSLMALGFALVCGLICACNATNAGPAPAPSAMATSVLTTDVSATGALAMDAPAASDTSPQPVAKACEPCFNIEKCNEHTGECEPNCPVGEVYVPKTGPDGFTMGQALRLPRDKPHNVVLTKPFCIDQNEITAGDYERCVKEQGCTPPRNIGPWGTFQKKPDHPVNKIDWKQAKFYCEKQGRNLPTEAQWEWAATGGDGRKWPWGNEQPTCDFADFTIGTMPTPAANAGCHGGGTSPVGAHPKGDRVLSTGVIHDLAGNVWEWVEDNYRPYSGEAELDPLHMDNVEATHVVRGGGWNRSVVGIQSAFRGGAVVDYQRPGLGGRCARHAESIKVAAHRAPDSAK